MIDVESSGWSGFSATTGIASFANLDAVRNPELTAEPYLARLWLRKVIALSDETLEIEPSPLGLLATLPARRIDIHVGKFTLPISSTSTRSAAIVICNASGKTVFI